MKQKWKKLGSVLLTLCMVLTLLPTVAFAADASSLKSAIEGYHGGTGTLSAEVSADGSTVTVTGEVTGADANFNLNIDAGVTVIWNASITTADDFTAVLFFLKGSGTFEVAEGGKIESTMGVAIVSDNPTDATDIIVKGTVSAAYDHAISISGTGATVDVSGGTVRGGEDNDGNLNFEDYSAIRTTGDNTTVNISGGYVTATSGTAIYSEGKKNMVNVSDGTVSSERCIAIHCKGDDAEVNISGGEVFNSSSGDSTINMQDATESGKLVVSGTGLVQAKGEAPAGHVPVRAIYTNGSVTVNGGTIQADHGKAILNFSSKGKMTEINDGTVSATSHTAIDAPYVTVNGGAVSATSGNAINVMFEAEINGGTVSATMGYAIRTSGDSTDVSVKGGVVSTTTGCAINAQLAGATLSISGGAVFAYASSISNVIDPVNFADTVPSDTGVVIAWNQSAGTTEYDGGNSTDLFVSPEGASATWGKNSGVSGISYSYSTNTGFIPVDGIITVITTDKIPVTITAAMPGGVYNGQPYAYSNAGVTTNTDSSNVTDSVTLEANYEGINGTTYGSSATAPKNAGRYQLTLSVPDSDATYSGSAVYTFTITKRQVTVKADDKSVTVGTDPVFTYTVDGQLPGETALIGEPDLAFAEGNTSKAGSYTIGVFLTGVSYTDNYMAADPAYVNGTLTVSNPSSGGDTPSGGGNGGSGGGGGGGSSAPAAPAPTVSGSTATTTVPAQTGTNGTATASVTQAQVTSAIEKAQAASKSSGDAPKVEIKVSGGSNASAVQTTIPKDAVQAMVSGKMDSLTLSGPVAAMTFDAQAIASIAGAASGDVKFSASKVETSTLPDAVRQVVGDHPVYNFSITSGSSTISQFGGTVTVSVPYTPAAGENVNAIVAYYINADSEPEVMQNCHYDAKTGTLVFTTTHFSIYAVGYHKVVFSDVAEDAWCYKAVTFLAARGITGGTTETAFSPNATLSRGQFITMVMRAYGIEPDNSSADNFSDAGNTYYTGYLAAAKRLGITNGVGGNKFAPKQAVSRQQMFALLYNALKAIDQLPEGDSGKTLSDFTDSANISSYAQEAMASMVEAGIVSGSNGNLRPTATTTRAQMAQVLYNLLSK